MAHAQIELYPSRPMNEAEQRDAALHEAYFAEVKWGWRKTVELEPEPERWADTGLVFESKQDAHDDATAKSPGWPVG